MAGSMPGGDDSREARLVSHHVGGRSGTRAFPTLERFEADLVNVLYEADADCLEQMRAFAGGQPSETLVLPHCLAGREEPRTFLIHRDQYLSSLYPLRREWSDCYQVTEDYGWDVDPWARSVHKRVACVTRTLDGVLARSPEVPPPDFLSLDTQGSELEILEGAAGTLVSSVLMVEAEVWFSPMYEGQCLYGEVAAFLEAKGFELASLEVLPATAPSRRTPVGLRGRGRSVVGEALFVRRPGHVGGAALVRLKLAFLCFVYGFFDRAWELLVGVPDGEMAELVARHGERRAWIRFLAACREALAGYPAVYPVPYEHIMRGQDLDRRFSGESLDLDTRVVAEAYLATVPFEEIRKAAVKFQGEGDIGVEAVARAFGFDAQAEALKAGRAAHFAHVLRFLGLKLSVG